MEFIMSLRINRTSNTESIKKSDPKEKTENKETKIDIKFDRKRIEDDMNKRIKKFNALKVVYTNFDEYNAALQKAISEGTYNPDAPEFIYANPKMIRSFRGLESITGDGSIVKPDGTINTDKYKEGMKYIAGNMSINVAEKDYAKYSEGLTSSEIKNLANPLGIKILSSKESEEEHQMNVQNQKPVTDDDDYFLFD